MKARVALSRVTIISLMFFRARRAASYVVPCIFQSSTQVVAAEVPERLLSGLAVTDVLQRGLDGRRLLPVVRVGMKQDVPHANSCRVTRRATVPSG